MTTKHRPPRRQPPWKGGRLPGYTGLIPALERALQREADRFGVTKSFVLASMAAFLLDVEDQPDYKRPAPKLRIVKKKSA